MCFSRRARWYRAFEERRADEAWDLFDRERPSEKPPLRVSDPERGERETERVPTPS
jgi:hypothetical protein